MKISSNKFSWNREGEGNSDTELLGWETFPKQFDMMSSRTGGVVTFNLVGKEVPDDYVIRALYQSKDGWKVTVDDIAPEYYHGEPEVDPRKVEPNVPPVYDDFWYDRTQR